MSRVIFILLAVALVPVAALAQTAGQPLSQPACKLTLAESPAIRGLKLGMSIEQLLSLFPGSRQSREIKDAIDNAQGYPNFGVAGLSFKPSGYPATLMDRFAGVDSIDVQLFDGEVAKFRVNYAGLHSRPRGPSWPNVDAFIAKLSEAFALPDTGVWLYRSENTKTLNCNGFEIHASNWSGSGSILLFNPMYESTVSQRATADEGRRRREFKP
jgi:hypothetical protein